MRDEIKRKLDQINELYPKSRLERSKERWRRLWHGEKPLDRLPFVAYPLTVAYYDDVDTPEQRLMRSLDEFIWRGFFADDFIPAFFTGCRQATIPSMFGAKEVVVGSDYSAVRLLHTPEDLDRLEPARVLPGSLAESWLRMQQYFVEETDGQMPVHVTDMQGPVDVAGQLWGYDNLLAAAYVDPDRYFRLLTLTSDAFIHFWNAQMDVIGKERFVGTHLFAWDWIPEDCGATLSADSMVMVSPDYYEAYYAPFHSKIGEVFGGFTVHSCGDFSKAIPAINRTPHIRGINAGQMSVEQLVENGIDKRLVIIANSGMDDADRLFSLIKSEHLRADVTIHPWPCNENRGRPQFWTKEDRLFVKRNEEHLLELASV